MELAFDFTGVPAGGGPPPEGGAGLAACYHRALGHELPNLMVAVRGFAGLIGQQLEGLAGAEVGEARELLARVARQAERADRLSRTLVELAREEPPGAFQRQSLREVAEEAAAEIRAQYGGRLREFRAGAGLPELALPRRGLYHVLSELMRNAVVFSPEPVTLTLAGACQPGGGSFTLGDDGPGFPQQQSERFFEPFEFLRAPPPPDGGVLPDQFGLGLFFVRLTVARWRGRLTLRSEPGRGTALTFFVPEQSGQRSAVSSRPGKEP